MIDLTHRRSLRGARPSARFLPGDPAPRIQVCERPAGRKEKGSDMPLHADRLRLFALVAVAAGLQAGATYLDLGTDDLLVLSNRAAATLGFDQEPAPASQASAPAAQEKLDATSDFTFTWPAPPPRAFPEACEIRARIARDLADGALEVTADCTDLRLNLRKAGSAARFALERAG